MRTPQPFPISFEFFPPKTPVGEEKLKHVRHELYAASPAFFLKFLSMLNNHGKSFLLHYQVILQLLMFRIS